jgi:hypothetical protein
MMKCAVYCAKPEEPGAATRSHPLIQKEAGGDKHDLVLDAFGRIPDQVHSVIDGLTPKQSTFRLDGDANSIRAVVVAPEPD